MAAPTTTPRSNTQKAQRSKPRNTSNTSNTRAKGNKPSSRNLLTSLVLVFPLFLIYQIGVLITYPLVNGADLLTRFLFQNLGLTRSAYLGYSALAAVLFAIAVLVLRRRQSLHLGMFLPMFLESAIFAATMGSAIVFVMTRALGVSPHLAFGGGASATAPAGIAEQGLLTRMVMSIGAGVWEETTFRLGILMGVLFLCERVIGMRRFFAIACAFAVSSLLFSAAHHIPPYGDPLELGIFTFRFLAGLCFALLFWFRGFAVAVYTHALYDLYVLVLRP